MSERRKGKNKLVYNKETHSIDTVPSHPEQQEGQARYYLQKFGDRAGICIIDRCRSGEKEAEQFDICMCRNQVEAEALLAILNQQGITISQLDQIESGLCACLIGSTGKIEHSDALAVARAALKQHTGDKQ